MFIAKIFQLPKNHFKEEDENQPDPENEAIRLKDYDNENIVKYVDSFYFVFPKPFGRSFVIIMEYCNSKFHLVMKNFIDGDLEWFIKE